MLWNRLRSGAPVIVMYTTQCSSYVMYISHRDATFASCTPITAMCASYCHVRQLRHVHHLPSSAPVTVMYTSYRHVRKLSSCKQVIFMCTSHVMCAIYRIVSLKMIIKCCCCFCCCCKMEGNDFTSYNIKPRFDITLKKKKKNS